MQDFWFSANRWSWVENLIHCPMFLAGEDFKGATRFHCGWGGHGVTIVAVGYGFGAWDNWVIQRRLGSCFWLRVGGRLEVEGLERFVHTDSLTELGFTSWLVSGLRTRKFGQTCKGLYMFGANAGQDIKECCQKFFCSPYQKDIYSNY